MEQSKIDWFVTNNGNKELNRTKGDLVNGVINLIDSDLTVTDCVFENNTGIYGGAIGYIDFTGNMDTCIAIRIAYKKNGKVFVRSGAGIVADSIPEKEYEECINKAKASLRALELAQEEDL